MIPNETATQTAKPIRPEPVRPVDPPRITTRHAITPAPQERDVSAKQTEPETAAGSPDKPPPVRVEAVSQERELTPPTVEPDFAVKAAPKTDQPAQSTETVETFIETEPAISVKSGTAPPAVKTDKAETPKRYFERTSEILAGRTAEPVEVQTILLREIQEWIAAGPAPAVDPVTREVSTNNGPIQIIEKPASEQPLPGVIRIGEAPRERPAELAAPQTSLIEEQSFELSIGSISVTIEGDAPPRPSAEIKRTETNSREIKPENGPRGSRLSRHYL